MARILWVDLMSLPHRQQLSNTVAHWHEVQVVTEVEKVPGSIRGFRPHLACMEFDYPDAARLRALSETRQRFPTLPIVMFTQFHSEALAVWAFRTGVCDYRVKPVSSNILAKGIALLVEASTRRGRRPSPGHALPPALIEPAGHLRRPPRAARKTIAAFAFIAEHYHENVRRSVLAKLCNLSESEFSRVFRNECGVTFEHYLLDYRIAMARDMLSEPELAISQVAYASGFNDPSYFCRVFRRLVGMTPKAYQQQAQLPLVARHGDRAH